MFNFLYIYNASAYVKPAKVTENVIVSKVMESSDNLALTLTNAGTVHQLLNEAKITIQDASGKVVTLTGTEMLPEIYGTNILARKTWTKTVPWPEGLSRGSSYKATIEYNYSAE